MAEKNIPAYKLYSVAQITTATYLGGPLAAGILLRQNYKNLEKEDYGLWSLIIGIVSTIFVIIGILAIPKSILDKIPFFLIPAIYTGIIYFFIKNLQGEEIEEHKKNNGKFYSFGNVIGISLICTIPIAAGIFGYSYLSPGINDAKTDTTQDVKPVIYGYTVKDQDSNTYKTVIIEDQIWMAENLKTTKYNDGTPIPLVTNSTAWSLLNSGAYCWYNNDSTNKDTYGALYNWYAVATDKLCPTGWYVPTDEEWVVLQNYFGGNVLGNVMKEKGTFHWHYHNTDPTNHRWLYPDTVATNERGFTALPGGHRSNLFLEDDTFGFAGIDDYQDIRNNDSTWKFCGIGYSGYWWFFLRYNRNADKADQVTMRYNNSDADTYDQFMTKDGLSVRCLKNIKAVTQNGSPYKEVKYGSTVKDLENNIYKTVQIGSQTWMVENLKTTKYNDGKAIRLVTSERVWKNLTTPGYCWYNNNPVAYKDLFGALYNWHTVNTDKLCPVGWHVPSDVEWIVLIDYLGGEDISAEKLREAWYHHWNYPNWYATNETGFTAVPGGVINDNGEFGGVGEVGVWWSSSRCEDPHFVWSRSMINSKSSLYREEQSKKNGFSVRCVKD
jgi:uncharacterized protein (TIGR02145 family)